MSDAAVILLAVQTALLLALLAVMVMVMQALRQAADKANALVAEIQATLENELKPALIEARSTLARTEKAAEAATSVLTAAHPVVSTASQVAGVFQKSSSPLWFDAAKLAIGLVGVIRNKRKESVPSAEKEN